MMDAIDRAAAPILIRRLGILTAISVAWEVERAKKKGEPFASLPPVQSDDERLSREQIGPAIVLYRSLIARNVPEALSITEEVIIAGAVVFLGQSIGQLNRDELSGMTNAQREHFLNGVGDKFFNATLAWKNTSAEKVQFTVSDCFFPQLCSAVGCSELAPSFCKGDATFFGEIVENVNFERPTTLARGDSNCDFRLSWRDK